MVQPHFAMLWNQDIPVRTFSDEQGREVRVTAVAGRLGEATPPSPPPRSWAARPDTDVAIWTIKLAPGATWTLPGASGVAREASAPTVRSGPAGRGTNRTLYFFRGQALRVGGREIPAYHGVELQAEAAPVLENGPEESELLLLQGRPIAEPVAQYGPFVMSSRAEIQQAFNDYQRTQFGGWPWPSDDPVHPREEGRFARHADGRVEKR
jgi:hypothetical protein